MKIRFGSFLGALALLVTLLPSGLLAGPLVGSAAVDFAGVTQNSTDGTWSLGFQFTTNTSLDVNALGFYDAGQTGGSQGLSGCTGCGEVGIYDSTGTLLVSALVTTGGTLIGDFYYVPVATTLLAAGQTYYAVAETGNADYTWDTTGFTVNPDITYVTDAYVSSATLAFPTLSSGYTQAGGGGYFGANFLETAAATPEPSSFWLLGTGLLGGLAFWAKRRHGVRA